MAKGKIVKSWRVTSYNINNGHRGMTGVSSYNCDYEQKHKNHKASKCDRVFKVFGNPERVVAIAARECEAVNYKNIMNGKGGRPISEFGRQFEFSFPKGKEPKTDEEWRVLAREALILIAKRIGISKEDLAKHSFATVHMNKKNPHMDLVVSKAINGKIHSKLNSDYLSNSLRAMSNAVMLKLGADFGTYEPVSKGRRQKWQKEQEEAKKALEETQEEKKRITSISKVFKSYAKTLALWFESQEEKEELKLSKKMQKQVNDVVDYGAGMEELEEFKKASELAEAKKNKKTNINFKIE